MRLAAVVDIKVKAELAGYRQTSKFENFILGATKNLVFSSASCAQPARKRSFFIAFKDSYLIFTAKPAGKQPPDICRLMR
jgi:hypothetical protein